MNIDQLLERLEALPKGQLLYGAGSVPRWAQGLNGKAVLSMVPVPMQTVGNMVKNLNQVLKKRLGNDIAFHRDVHGGEAIHIDVVRKSTVSDVDYIVAELVVDATVEMWLNVPVETLRVHTAFNSAMGNGCLGIGVVKRYWEALNEEGKTAYLRELTSIKAWKYVDGEGKEVMWNKEAWGIVECPCPPVVDDKVVTDLNGFD